MAAGETWRKGLQSVIDEVERRGGRANESGARGRGIHHLLIDCPSGRWRARLKTKSSGTWQDDTGNGTPATADDVDDCVWIYVDVKGEPSFFVAPAWWAVNDIQDAHAKYLARHGGRRAVTQGTTHHAIPLERVLQWKDRWDIIGL